MNPEAPVWQSSASVETLRARAGLMQCLRDFLCGRGLLEVEVPVLARRAAMDPHIASITAETASQLCYLQSSPEYFLKRLLASDNSVDIFSLGKAFRDGEQGARHNPEFTLLEWYRSAIDERQLMDEVEALLRFCLPLTRVQRYSYRQLFQQHLGRDPHSASLETLQSLAREHVEVDWRDQDRDLWLDLLMTHVIEPKLGEGLVFVYDYPASQAALARITEDDQGQPVARRFEAYVDGLELANGYWELNAAAEQRTRFRRDQQCREQLGLPILEMDEQLLRALESGLPDCAGVALGVDRLLMCQLGVNDIRQLLAFPFERC